MGIRVIHVKDINRIKTEMFNQINECIHHSYLKKYLQTPNVDEDKLYFLIAICNELKLEVKTINTYIITTMLVQIALDTHELVSVGSNMGEKQQKVQQLTVLAGDYYSGLYYKLLADIEDTQMIKLLAESIKLINEHKIRVYRHDLTYPDSLLDSIKIIEGQLFKSIAKLHHLSFWEELIPEILLLKRLNKELAQLHNNGYSAISAYLVKETYELQPELEISSKQLEQDIQGKIEVAILNSREKIITLLEENQQIASNIKSGIFSMVKQLENPMHVIVEEG